MHHAHRGLKRLSFCQDGADVPFEPTIVIDPCDDSCGLVRHAPSINTPQHVSRTEVCLPSHGHSRTQAQVSFWRTHRLSTFHEMFEMFKVVGPFSGRHTYIRCGLTDCLLARRWPSISCEARAVPAHGNGVVVWHALLTRKEKENRGLACTVDAFVDDLQAASLRVGGGDGPRLY